MDVLLSRTEGGDFVRGDYDHNHSLSTVALALIVIVVLLVGLGLGGLSMGLSILS